jgi:hypothetical protein
MNMLREHTNRLLSFLESSGLEVPGYNGKLYVLEDKINHQVQGDYSVGLINRQDLSIMSDFVDDYATLLGKGYSWINFSCQGLLENSMLIVIETPESGEDTGPGVEDIQINYSGPRTIDDVVQWEADIFYEVVS